MHKLPVCILIALVVAAFARPAVAEKRLALAIGNDAYTKVARLEKAVNDARAVGDTFRQIGFEVTVATDVSRREMNRTIQEFANQIEPGDVVAFFYAGHGVEIDGANYLLPVDVPNGGPEDRDYVKGEAIGFNRILSTLEKRSGRINLIILDACRDNPFASRSGRSLGQTRGLARIPEVAGTFIMYSAGVRQKALDSLGAGDPDPNSVFTRALIPLLKSPRYDLASIALEVRKRVKRLAQSVSHRQRPAFYNDLDDKFYLVSRDTKPAPAPVVTPAIDKDALFWASIRNSKAVEDFEAYLKQFPNGTYAALAKRKIVSLGERQVSAEPPTKSVRVEPTVPARPEPESRRAGDRFQDCEDCPEMIILPSGSFVMGSPQGEPGRRLDEGPRHTVTIAGRFAVGRFEVTYGQFDVFVRETNFRPGGNCHVYNGSSFSRRTGATYRSPGFSQSRDHPVSCVSWYDAKAFVGWLNTKVPGSPYRLPTEAEWEYAARANTRSVFSFGNTAERLCRFGNVGDAGCPDGVGMRTATVGRYEPNQFGLYDMHGNMWEWVEDCYKPSYVDAPGDGSAVLSGPCEKRVLRSGGWNSTVAFTRSATRDKFFPDGRYSNGGFRVAKTLSD